MANKITYHFNFTMTDAQGDKLLSTLTGAETQCEAIAKRFAELGQFDVAEQWAVEMAKMRALVNIVLAGRTTKVE